MLVAEAVVFIIPLLSVRAVAVVVVLVVMVLAITLLREELTLAVVVEEILQLGHHNHQKQAALA
jgi:hypothetical protein